MTPRTPLPQASTLSSAVIRRTVKLAEIPAPAGREDTRRERVRSWWLRDGWADVRTDDAGNLWARVRPGDGPAVVLAAHLDTVFGDTVDHRVRQEGTRLCGPSVGDDSASMPAIAIGVTTGGGEHTPDEWIDTSPLGAGLGCAAATIAGWEGVGCDQP